MTLFDRLIQQLDTLVPFLELSHEKVFSLIHDKNKDWFPSKKSLPDTLGSYQSQIAHSAFLLGYSYFEAFLSDLSKEIFKKRPALLPGNKQLKFSEILDLKNYDSIVTNMIDKHVISILYNSLESVGEYYRDKLNIAWPDSDEKASFIEGSLIRNCIMHNGSVVDYRLAKISKWSEGDMIKLLPDDVHDYGLELRSLTHTIHEEAIIKHLKDETK